MNSLVGRWNGAYFGNRLSPEAITALEPLNRASPDAQALADRTFRLMLRARFDPRDLSAHTAQVLGAVHTSVPSAWDGAVPPITLPGRHRKLDDYVAANPWHQPGDEPVLLDLGCGFPPLTALDSAATLTGWRVIGVDPCFDRYLLHDGDHYACFGDDQRLRYLRHGAVHPDTAPARAHFRALLHRLLPLLPTAGDGEVAEVEQQGARLVRNPLRRYERDNLTLTQGEIGTIEVEGGVDVIRCMNVLMYFDQAFRERARVWATSLLRPGGLLICGNNWTHSTSSRYTVYQEQDRLLVCAPSPSPPGTHCTTTAWRISATPRQWESFAAMMPSGSDMMSGSIRYSLSTVSAAAGLTVIWEWRNKESAGPISMMPTWR